MALYDCDDLVSLDIDDESEEGREMEMEEVLNFGQDVCEDTKCEEEVRKEEAKKESKTNKENALECFGLDETKSEKWMIKFGKFWYDVLSFVWLVFGAFTFSFVIFISQKIDVLFNNKKRSILFAIGAYCAILALVVLLIFIRK
ncbi:MAG: hypothetical protein J6V20_01670 [Bacteroidaceae bacterium]|nr:hypothetical protein [Bacteroidaceae bacterium]